MQYGFFDSSQSKGAHEIQTLIIDTPTFYCFFNLFLDLDNIIKEKMSQAVDERGMKLWQCNDCGYARERKSDVTKHVERRHIEMQVACDLCNAIFSSRQSLKEHAKYKH